LIRQFLLRIPIRPRWSAVFFLHPPYWSRQDLFDWRLSLHSRRNDSELFLFPFPLPPFNSGYEVGLALEELSPVHRPLEPLGGRAVLILSHRFPSEKGLPLNEFQAAPFPRPLITPSRLTRPLPHDPRYGFVWALSV